MKTSQENSILLRKRTSATDRYLELLRKEDEKVLMIGGADL